MRLTYKLDEKEQDEHKTKYLRFQYFPIPDYCIEKGNYGRITTADIYNKLGKLEDLEEILMNGYTDKNGKFHREVYLAYIDDEWCICDMNTDEYFLVEEEE